MLLGTYFPKLDDKGRLILPARFREQVADGIVVTRTHDHALVLFPQAEFQRQTADLQKAPDTSKRVREYKRMIFGEASFEVPDRQGRITIPPRLRAYAGLDRDVVVVGGMDKAEIWDQARWDAYQEGQEEGFAGMDEDFLAQLGRDGT